ncbi:ApbE family lipoprotein [Sulfobacillus acidophilus DSM 10332]|uniref:FAD:protein FMN transferase n=1 Tax=Sulfobacillus acidophilus (strain ATCC 700253 / DSM 10332 / NAL) TaxID=679936 RepID=G8TUB2_SULAD|nr:ApbE family lipoprotein [Sulfobacillus acidophilus DSM 10332]
MITRHWRAMASPIEWLIDSPTETDWIDPLADHLQHLFDTVERHLSRFREDSEAVQLNRRLGDWVKVSPILYEALRLSHRAWRITQGLFDPRIITDLERLGYHGAAIPGSLTQSADDWLTRCPRTATIRLRAPVDFGGIGKSLAVYWAALRIRRHKRFQQQTRPPMLLNAGGDLQIMGPAIPAGGWQIGIEHPVTPDHLAAVLNMSVPLAVCTSSIRRHQWMHDGRPVHHLIHPFTHQPGGSGLLSVTVAHRAPTWAEIWSKALFLHGRQGIAAAAARHRLVAWWFSADGRWGATPEAFSYIRWVHPDFSLPRTTR